MYRPYDYGYDSDTNAVSTNSTTEPHSLPWPRTWPDPTHGSTRGCTWAEDDLLEDIIEPPRDNSVYGRFGVFVDEDGDDEEAVFFADDGGLIDDDEEEEEVRTRGPEEVCLFPSVWSELTRTQPRKHRSGVRGSGGRRTTTRKNKKRRCPRRRQESRRRAALRRKRLARRARVGGRRRRPRTCFLRGGAYPEQDGQVCFMLWI